MQDVQKSLVPVQRMLLFLLSSLAEVSIQTPRIKLMADNCVLRTVTLLQSNMLSHRHGSCTRFIIASCLRCRGIDGYSLTICVGFAISYGILNLRSRDEGLRSGG